jgi:hypothetical protein
MKDRLPFILLIIISLAFIFSFYGKVILQPDSYLFNDKGDAVKNYFTYAYHIKHDSSFIDFEGMNYPYGEHFLYTDCHPALAVLIKLSSPVSDFFSTYSIGILNFLMILSVFLTFIICYFLLREFDINKWFSVLFSLGITVLAPQIFRLSGHFALSYSIAIPLSWFMVIKYLKHNEQSFYLVILFINNLFWIFIHAYLGVIVVSFLTLIVIGKYTLDKSRIKKTLFYLRTCFVIVFPVVIFYLFTVLTDDHTGRTDHPSGFFQYNAEPDDIFFPNHPPLKPLLDKMTGNIISQQWEAWSYIGFSTTILFLSLLILSVKKLVRKSKSTPLNNFFSSELLNISLVAAFIVLLFAMAFPFKLIPGLVDFIPVVKQFRATGRFAWPFYFAATVFAAFTFQKLYADSFKKGRSTMALSLCIAVGLLNIAEGLPYHMESSVNITKSGNLFNKKLLPEAYEKAVNTINPEDYQAILTLPFYYQGSESYSRPRYDETSLVSMCVSYQTGIPLICANLTRTSIRESKNIVQIVSPDFYYKQILNDLPDNKPFLVIRTKDAITYYEQDILMKCEPVFVSENISLFTLKKADLFTNNAQAYYNNFKQLEPSLIRRDQFYLSDDSSFLYYNGFENLKSDKPFRGKGGFQSVKKGKNTLAEFQPYSFAAGKEYQVSVWMFNGLNHALDNWFRLIVEEYDEETNTWASTTYFPEQSEVINGDWSLAGGSFKIKKPGNRIFIVTKGKNDAKEPLFIDDLLIRESGVDVFGINENDKKLFYNNHDILFR